MEKNSEITMESSRAIYWGIRLNTMMIIIRGLCCVVFGLLLEYAMLAESVLSIPAYIAARRLMQKSPRSAYLLVIIEVYVHMATGIISMGWSSGFQNFVFAIAAISFYSEYALRRDHRKSFKALIPAAVFGGSFMAAKLYSILAEPLRQIPETESNIFYLVNSGMALLLIINYSYIYASRTLEIEEQLENMASRDNLTGLANRHVIPVTLNRLGIGLRGDDQMFSAAILDIDNFKKVNDTYGHLAGDQVLIRLADNLRKSKADFVCRWGGEEFMILAVGKDSKEKLLAITEKVRGMMNISAAAYDGVYIRVTVSVGLAEFAEGELFQETVERADKALYYAKTHGKNQVVISGENDH